MFYLEAITPAWQANGDKCSGIPERYDSHTLVDNNPTTGPIERKHLTDAKMNCQDPEQVV